MHIGITGSRGFIGSYLLDYVLSLGADRVRILQRTVGAPEGAFDDRRIEIVKGCLESREACMAFVSDLDVIYYLAHRNSPVDSDDNQAQDAALNIIPLLEFICAVRDCGKRPHIVYFSSGGAIYGPEPNRIPVSEATECRPTCSYGIQKLAAEHYLRLAAERRHLTAIALRVGNAYGTLLPQTRIQGLIGVAVNNAVHGKPVRVFGNMGNVRDYVHLADVCAMVDLAARSRRPWDVINVGTGRGHSVAQVLRLIEDCNGSPIQVEFDAGPGDALTDWAVLDITKAKREFGWTPKMDLRAGIQEMLANYRSNLARTTAVVQ